jgi:hypothetical protein
MSNRLQEVSPYRPILPFYSTLHPSINAFKSHQLRINQDFSTDHKSPSNTTAGSDMSEPFKFVDFDKIDSPSEQTRSSEDDKPYLPVGSTEANNLSLRLQDMALAVSRHDVEEAQFIARTLFEQGNLTQAYKTLVQTIFLIGEIMVDELTRRAFIPFDSLGDLISNYANALEKVDSLKFELKLMKDTEKFRHGEVLVPPSSEIEDGYLD